jgi:hypothetical protein
MTKEVLKLALDALELVNIEFVCNGAHHAKKDRHGLDEDCPVTMRYRKAIAALKERLAQPEQEPVAWMTINGYGEEDDIHYENPKNHLMEGWTYKPLYTQPAPMAQPELNAAIVQTLLPKLYSIIDRLLDGQDKALVIEARRVLPRGYKNSFEKGKGV